MSASKHLPFGLILVLGMAVSLSAQVPTAPQTPQNTAELSSATVLKAITTEHDGYKFVAYLVKWHDAEVVVQDPLARSHLQVGNSIDFVVTRRSLGVSGENQGILSFIMVPNLPVAQEQTPRGADSASLEERNRRMKMLSGDLSVARDESERFYALSAAARRAFGAGNPPEAEKLARELAALAPKYKQDWNYGNAVQNANQVLGLIALAANDVPEAKRRLLASADSDGSPQMNSFGPNMRLAKALLEKGEKEVVLEYFQRCGRFWKMGGGKLKSWRESVIRGDMPDFGANLDY